MAPSPNNLLEKLSKQHLKANMIKNEVERKDRELRDVKNKAHHVEALRMHTRRPLEKKIVFGYKPFYLFGRENKKHNGNYDMACRVYPTTRSLNGIKTDKLFIKWGKNWKNLAEWVLWMQNY